MACASRDGRCFCAATRVEGHLTPIAQQHKPTWQQTSLSTKDSQHVRGGTPNLKQKRWTQQRSSPLHDAPMHSGQSAYKLKLQQRHPLMRMRSDLRAETVAAAAYAEILGQSPWCGGGRRARSISALVLLVHDLHHDCSYDSRRNHWTTRRGGG